MADSGKGKAPASDAPADEYKHDSGKGPASTVQDPVKPQREEDEESSSDEEVTGIEEELDDNDEGEDDGMAEIDTDNIISDGRRTRGKAIDFAKAAEGLDDEEDEDDDDDFEDPDAMKE